MTRSFKAVLLFAVILLQTTVLPHFTPLSVIPDYTFLVIVAISIISDDAQSVVLSALAGFVTDILTGAPTGLNTLLYMYISIGIVFVSGMIYNKTIKIASLFCFIASFVYEMMFGIMSSLFRGASFKGEYILKVVLTVSLVNAVIIIPVYLLLSHVRFEKKRKGIKYERQI